MGTSTLQRVEVRRARGSTCTHRPYRACPCGRFLCGGGRARARARPVPCRLLGLCIHYDATCRLDHVRMTQHAKDYLLERKTNALPFSFTLTGVLCALELVADMPHACDDTCGLAHARMTPQNYECARGRKRMRRAHSHEWVVRLPRLVSKGCAMDNMVLGSNLPYVSWRVRDGRMCGGRICADAGVRMATWCGGVCVRFSSM